MLKVIYSYNTIFKKSLMLRWQLDTLDTHLYSTTIYLDIPPGLDTLLWNYG